MKILGFIVLFAVLLVGCSTEIIEPIGGADFSKSFIQVYIIPDETTVCAFENEKNAIFISFEGENILYGEEPFASFSEHYGDTSYNRKIVHFINRAVADEYISLDIVCDKDFGDNHPAGTSLNDITELYGTSYFNYIQSGYEEKFNWNDAPEELEEFSMIGTWSSAHFPVKKLLSELMPSDLILLNRYAYLKFTEEPSSGEYLFTITFRTADKMLSKDVTVNY